MICRISFDDANFKFAKPWWHSNRPHLWIHKAAWRDIITGKHRGNVASCSPVINLPDVARHEWTEISHGTSKFHVARWHGELRRSPDSCPPPRRAIFWGSIIEQESHITARSNSPENQLPARPSPPPTTDQPFNCQAVRPWRIASAASAHYPTSDDRVHRVYFSVTSRGTFPPDLIYTYVYIGGKQRWPRVPPCDESSRVEGEVRISRGWL